MSKPKILAVDDEEFNLDILSEYLSKAGFEVISADDGDVALQKISEHRDISVVVLDRMMPRMDGIDVVKTMKKDSRYKHIPIVMQTAAAQTDQVIEGINLGVYYYLSKPYQEEILINVVRAAHNDSQDFVELREESERTANISHLIKKGFFHFSNLSEAKILGNFMGNCFPEQSEASRSLITLLSGAIYSNLSHSFTDRIDALMAGELDDDIQKLLGSANTTNIKCTVNFEMNKDQIIIQIKDGNKGFDWKKYMTPSITHSLKKNPIGIMQAKAYFSSLGVSDDGENVVCVKLLNGAKH